MHDARRKQPAKDEDGGKAVGVDHACRKEDQRVAMAARLADNLQQVKGAGTQRLWQG